MWTRHDGALIYKAVADGFTAFAMLWKQYGDMDNFHVISRTQKGEWFSWHSGWKCEVEAYVVRVVRAAGLTAMGMPEDNVHLRSGKSGPLGKGPVAQSIGVTTFSDNDYENL